MTPRLFLFNAESFRKLMAGAIDYLLIAVESVYEAPLLKYKGAGFRKCRN